MSKRISLKKNQYNLPVGQTGTVLREINTRMFDKEKSYLVKLDGASYNLHFFLAANCIFLS